MTGGMISRISFFLAGLSLLLVMSVSVSCGLAEPDTGKDRHDDEETDSGKDRIILYKDLYHFSAKGGDLRISFSTDIDPDILNVGTTASWIGQDADTKAAAKYSLNLNIEPNDGDASRIGYIVFYTDGNAHDLLATVTIVQDGQKTGTSEDYSEDGTVSVIQRASRGNGIPVVIMGDGFIDTEISSGKYDEVMDKAAGHLFSETPLSGLQDYFDVYAVTVVSENNSFGPAYSTALGCEFEGGYSTGISGDDDAVMEYASKVSGLDIGEALIVVILNNDRHAGTTYFGYGRDNGGETEYVEMAIAYCPVIESLESEEFRQVLVHEAAGHGFGKLEDEYRYDFNGVIPTDEAARIQARQQLGWALNVDFTDDRSKVLWRDFLADARYAHEDIGIYEGACSYMSGVYRSSEDSMMGSNTLGFNAQSRRVLYDMVMRRGAGTEPSYEEFVSFDMAAGQCEAAVAERVDMLTNSVEAVHSSADHPLPRPRFVDRKINL